MGAVTRTGGFAIGFRQGWSDWQTDFEALTDFALEAGFSALDAGRDGDVTAKKILDSGLKLGAVDLPEWQGLIDADPSVREQAACRNSDYIKACAEVAGPGVKHFCVMLPADQSLARDENFRHLVAGFALIVDALESAQAKLVVEGWPGQGALCCTPEGYRALFESLPSPALGINYDPSHLIRMGIDPIRFVDEFAQRIYHVHAKDTEVDPQAVYNYGTEQPTTFYKPTMFGGPFWRYTIPGHGQMRWTEALRILEADGYDGGVSIELEDARFNGTEAGEKQGLKLGLTFLEGC